MPAVLPTVGRRGPRPEFFVGTLQSTGGNTEGVGTPFSIHFPINLGEGEDAQVQVEGLGGPCRDS